jgi:hypothetical protein
MALGKASLRTLGPLAHRGRYPHPPAYLTAAVNLPAPPTRRRPTPSLTKKAADLAPTGRTAGGRHVRAQHESDILPSRRWQPWLRPSRTGRIRTAPVIRHPRAAVQSSGDFHAISTATREGWLIASYGTSPPTSRHRFHRIHGGRCWGRRSPTYASGEVASVERPVAPGV